MKKQRIKRLIETSKKVILDCCLENGAIVAANSTKHYYPRDVKNYFYVWPRDASFICYACDLLGMHHIPEKFFQWCWERAEGFRENGIFLAHKFDPHGRATGDWDVGIRLKDIKNKRLLKGAKGWLQIRLFYIKCQPDHTGSLLWAIYEHSKYSKKEYKEIVTTAADGICKFWEKTHFKIPTDDIWEEKKALPELKQSHTYSVAICLRGLECASKLVEPKKRWLECIEQMKKVLEKSYSKKLGYFVKTYGKKVDTTVDSSSLGLVWPSMVFDPYDERMVNTVKKIVENNEIEGGIYRYPNDKYDGKIEFGKITLGGAGAWPILNFWMSIYYSLLGNRRKAEKYYFWVLERVEDYIPEQIKNNKPASITPLAWSHAMFVIASKKLGFL
jgi:GH15 family glucan-1,4-alpha-glucosidase